MIKFKTCTTLEDFKKALGQNKIEPEDIVYITGAKIIWARDHYFYCDANDRLGNYSIAVVKEDDMPDNPAADTIYMVI